MNDTDAYPPLGFRPAAVLFDMDGLLLDSECALLDCWREAARQQGVHVDDAVWLSMIGLSDAVCDELLARSIGEHDARALRGRCQALYDARVERGIPVKPDAFELLTLLQAHAVPRAVVTSTWRERARQKLAAAGLLPHFDDVIGGRDAARPKPAPDPYLLAAQRLQVAPDRCVVLEDSGAGVRAALAAGMHAIQVPDLAQPDADVRALGHRVVATLRQAQALIEAALGP
jgi:HAD superfamily hydrolase (TIGR01509 family)